MSAASVPTIGAVAYRVLTRERRELTREWVIPLHEGIACATSSPRTRQFESTAHRAVEPNSLLAAISLGSGSRTPSGRSCQIRGVAVRQGPRYAGMTVCDVPVWRIAGRGVDATAVDVSGPCLSGALRSSLEPRLGTARVIVREWLVR
ncbi:hypothetical protein GCM10018779_05270 [Streptomyces griseocarneus]|nr:hypothetical protein GCM10018779_05270 [Streptomyces griseocarneus]